MASYKEIQEKIAQLQQEAEQLRKKELADVIADIRQKMITYGISVEDIGKLPSTKKARKPSISRGVPKYRNPATGTTWTGKGKSPQWVRDYEASGKSRDDLLI